MLNAVTREETAHLVQSDGTRRHQIVEPLTNYFVGRVKKDMLQGNLVIGAIATSTLRNMDCVFTPRLSEELERAILSAT